MNKNRGATCDKESPDVCSVCVTDSMHTAAFVLPEQVTVWDLFFFFLCTRNTLLAKIRLFAACVFYGFRLDPLKGY